MPERKTIQGYLDEVGAQIRWKRARPVVLRELEQPVRQHFAGRCPRL